MSRSTGSSPTHIAFTRQLSRYDSSKTASPPTVGTPTELPYAPIPPTARENAWSGSAKRRPSSKRDRPRSHGDDVAEDPADPGRRALERLDGGRVVVAFDLERDGQSVPEVEHAGVLTRSLEDARAARGEPLQKERRVLVAAVLGPEEREHRQLEVVRVPREQRADSLVLPVREAECAMERRFRHAAHRAAPGR